MKTKFWPLWVTLGLFTGFMIACVLAIFGVIPTTDGPQAPITSMACNPALTPITGSHPDANISAMQYTERDGGTFNWSTQYVCDGREVKVDIAKVHVEYNEGTRVVHLTWSATIPVEWKEVVLIMRSGEKPPVRLRPDQTSYDFVLPSMELLDHVQVFGYAPSLPPPVLSH